MYQQNEAESMAALELLHIKNNQPSNLECRSASKLLCNIMQQSSRVDVGGTGSTRKLVVGVWGEDSHPVDAAVPSSSNVTTKKKKKKKSRATRRRRPVEAAAPFMNALVVPSISSASSSTSKITSLPAPVAESGNDELHLSSLQCYLRKEMVEYFEAKEGDVGRGRQTKVTEGRVGVRCLFCKHLPKEERASQAVSYPNKISSIQSAVVMLQCRHHPNCTEVPASVRKELNRLKRSGTASTSGVKRQDYWVESAVRMGFVDSQSGVRFVPPVMEEEMEVEKKTTVEEEDTTMDMDVDTKEDEVTVAPPLSKKAPPALDTSLGLSRPNVITPVDEPNSNATSWNASSSQGCAFFPTDIVRPSPLRRRRSAPSIESHLIGDDKNRHVSMDNSFRPIKKLKTIIHKV